MTEAPEMTRQAFKANFQQIDVLMGATVLTMELDFAATEVGTWAATGSAHLGQSTNPPLDLRFPMTGELSYNPESDVVPTEYTLRVHSDFPDHQVGISLSVDLTAASFEPPTVIASLEFTGEYTWLQGPPQTVTGAKFEMTHPGL